MMDSIFSWTTLWWFLMILYIPACIGLIVIVLLQKGKGSGFAGAFGVGGGSETVFGPRAYKSLPVRLTYGMAATFMLIAVIMSVISGKINQGVAPELVEVSAEDGAATTPSSGLADLGIGTGQVGAVTTTPATDESAEAAPATGDAAPTTEAPAAEEVAPATVEAAPAAEQPAAAAEDAPPAEDAPAQDENPTPNNGR